VDPSTAEGSWLGADTPHYSPDRQPLSSPSKLAENPVHQQRSKHSDIKYHWIRGIVSSRTVQLIDVPTEDQRADFLTKALRGDVFWGRVRAVLIVS
jgi:hypothetical protein